METPAATQDRPFDQTNAFIQAYVEETLALFPRLAGRLLVINMQGDMDPAFFGDLDPQKTGMTEEEAADKLWHHAPLFKALSKNDGKGAPMAFTVGEAWCGINFLCLNRLRIESKSDEQFCLGILDHERGHLVMKDGGRTNNPPSVSEANLSETAADAYALMCAYQRFGTAEPYPEGILTPIEAANLFCHKDDPDHFSAFTTDAIAHRRHLIDFKNAAQEDLMRLAWRFAVEYAQPEPVLLRLRGELEPLWQESQGEYQLNLPKTLEKALDPETDAVTFSLMGILVRQSLHATERHKIELRPHTKELLSRFRVKELQMAKEEMLVRGPVAPPEPAPFSAPSLGL